MKQKMIAACLVALTAGGCVDKNYVDTFEPTVDMAGVDEIRYNADLKQCRSYAVKEDPANKAARDAMAGALLGAALGAAAGASVGHGGRFVGYGAAHGAVYGGIAAGAAGAIEGVRAQQIIVSRCMAGRGYNVLYGGSLAP